MTEKNKRLIPPKKAETMGLGEFYPKNSATIANLARLGLNGTAICIYDLLCCFYNPNAGFSHPSYQTIANILGCDVRLIKRNVKSLEDKGLLKKLHRVGGDGGNLSNMYYPLVVNQKLKDFMGVEEADCLVRSEEGNRNSCEEIKEGDVFDIPGRCQNEHPDGVKSATQIIIPIKKSEIKKSNAQFHEDSGIPNSMGKDRTKANSQQTLMPGVPPMMPGCFSRHAPQMIPKTTLKEEDGEHSNGSKL